MEELRPMPGDVVRLTRDWNGMNAGRIAVLDGIVGEAQMVYLAVFAYSVFRGNSFGGPDYVSCSGGPCPYVTSAELRPSGGTTKLAVWRWKDGWARADNGEHYVVEVPVWDWAGPAGRDGGQALANSATGGT